MSDMETPDEPDPADEEPGLPPVPELLYSAFHEGPFKTCVACGSDLSGPEAMYQIQKTWKNGEVTFELAICVRCAANCAKEFSKESFERIQEFLASHYKPSMDLSHCHLCDRRLGGSEPAEYEAGAFCRGGRLLRPVVVICTTCSEKSQENLSEKTRKAWGDFVDRNLPGVPFSLEPDKVPLTF
jgi:hypothetical protein